MTSPAAQQAPEPSVGREPWPLGRMIWAGVAASVLVALVAAVVAGAAFHTLSAARHQVISVADPAASQTLQLYASMINQETGVRGYELSAAPNFLQPYTSGLTQQRSAQAALRSLLGAGPAPSPALATVDRRISDWQVRYATPTIAQVRASGKPVISPGVDKGKADFDALRASISVLQGDISRYRQRAVANLDGAIATLRNVIIGIGLALLVIIGLFALAIRRAVERPIARLAVDARMVAGGDFDHAARAGGARETTELGADVNRMRARIVSALGASRAAEIDLRALAEELQRSNSELEQFAYVASHDLQEPLRKVASFCQLLQRRYGGKFDEKANQYIAYAVDGAKRMQMLINDLLAFSRVGRTDQERVPVPAAELVAQAQATLATAMRRARAEVEAGELPTVLAEPTLLTAVFQNLLSNAIKFRGERSPLIAVTAERDGDFWVFSVADNGIGISSEYA